VNWIQKLLWRLRGSPASGGARSRGSEPTIDQPTAAPVSVNSGDYELRAGVWTTIGNVREHNEDNYYVPGVAPLRNGPAPHDDIAMSTSTWDEEGGASFRSTISSEPTRPVLPAAPGMLVDGPENLFIVADGMGGQLAGEKASQMAVELIPTELKRLLAANHREERAIAGAIRSAVSRANDEILILSGLGAEHANMGTTLVLAYFDGARVFVLGIGDSRVYRLRETKLDQLTKDHSLANALVEAGTIRTEEVETHKFRHVLYLYLGSKEARDAFEEIRPFDIRPGDQFLLATDGLMNVVRDDMIQEIMRANPDPQKSAQVLVNRALKLGSKDNITCLVIHVV
jgi:protein phosphatase